MADEKLLLDADAIQRGLTRTAHEIAEANADSKSVGLIGIQRGGVHLAKRLAGLLTGIWGHDAPVGVLDVSMHRDDIDQRGIVSVQPTEVPFDPAFPGLAGLEWLVEDESAVQATTGRQAAKRARSTAIGETRGEGTATAGMAAVARQGERQVGR